MYKIQINSIILDQIDPKRLYNTKEIFYLTNIYDRALIIEIKKGTIHAIRRRKHKHYRVLGSELIRFINESGLFDIINYGIE
jgi:hypothetical protein